MRDCQLSAADLAAGGCGVDEASGRDNCGDAVLSPLFFVSFMLICTYRRRSASVSHSLSFMRTRV